MSQENVEIVRRMYAGFNRGAHDAPMDLFSPDAELRDLQGAPDQPFTVRGAEAMRELLANWMAAFDELSVEVAEYIDAGDAVIAAAHWHGQGKASGLAVDHHQLDLLELREGKVVRATLGYRTKAEALEAAGLSE
jgi:ketosteroid isomerase-like protein